MRSPPSTARSRTRGQRTATGPMPVTISRSGAIAQNLCQRIAESPWLGELDHIILGHGVSLLGGEVEAFEHPHDTPPPYPFIPSPTFAHSSGRRLRPA